TNKATGKVLTQSECEERLAFTDWDRRLVLDQMWRRVQEPPFTSQLEHEKLVEQWSRLRSELLQKTDAQGLAKAAETYQRALARRPEDWRLHHRFAGLLETSGDLVAAEQHWKEVAKLLPDYPDALFKLGEVCATQSRLGEAADYYK